ncbi:MAG: hypothetical protein QOD01_2294, partial [Actinomycetota bacterium]|nr:hypothetical protein [Actinomycetota bacterium]
LDNDRDAVVGIVLQVLDVQVDDGVIFELGRLTAALIRDTEMYAGVRLAVPARLDRAQVVLRLDVNVGDPVTPEPVAIDFPTLLAGSFRLLGYPLATVLAEKIITMIDRGATTTRERDFADILLVTRRHPIDAKELRQALMATALHRQSQQRGLASLLDDLGLTRQRSWVAYLDRNGLSPQLPSVYAEAIDEVVAFADPLLNGVVTGGAWDPVGRTWMPAESPGGS